MPNAGGAREAGGCGGLLTPAVGPEAHLLLAWPGCLLEWRCHRSPLLATLICLVILFASLLFASDLPQQAAGQQFLASLTCRGELSLHLRAEKLASMHLDLCQVQDPCLMKVAASLTWLCLHLCVEVDSKPVRSSA